MKNTLQFLLLFVLGIFGTNSTSAQEDANWRYLRPSNTGLPGNYVTRINSDTCNNLWVGAYNTFWEDGGLGEFDGLAWKNWTNFEGHLPSARVRAIFFDKQNHVWIGTDSGVVHYDRDTTWQIWTAATSNLPDDDIYSITADAQNNIWISINGGINGSGGLASWNGSAWTTFTQTNSSLPTESIGTIDFDKSGNLWIASSMGLLKYDGLNFIRYHTGNSGIANNSLIDLTFDENGLLWILSHGGLNTFDGTIWQNYPGLYTVAPQQAGFSALDVKNGQIAVSELVGFIHHYDGTTWNSYPASNHMYDVHFDNQGALWVCGIGYLAMQISGSDWKTYRRYNSGLADYFNNDIFIDSKNRKWFASSSNGGHSFFDDVVWRTFGFHNNGFEPYPFPTTSLSSATAQDTAGYIWMSVYATAEGIARWNENLNTFDIVYNSSNTGVWMQFINTLVIDPANRIWAGSNGNGIYMYDGNQWNTINQSNSMLQSNYINQLFVDYAGDVWAGTQSGVVKFSGGSITGTLFNTSNSGIISNFVNEIVQQPNGIYWFGTGEGISKLDGQTWTSYTEIDGIGGRVVDGLAWDEMNQLLYVGAYEVYNWPYYGGLSIFDGTNWTSFLQDSSPIAHKQVEDLELDQYGNLWILSQTMGITIYNPNGVVGLDDPNSDCLTWVSLPTGIGDEYQVDNISIYPNPASDYLHIDFNGASFELIEIIDITGKLVERIDPGRNAITFTANIQSLASGVYYLRVKTDQGFQSLPFIKTAK